MLTWKAIFKFAFVKIIDIQNTFLIRLSFTTHSKSWLLLTCKNSYTLSVLLSPSHFSARVCTFRGQMLLTGHFEIHVDFSKSKSVWTWMTVNFKIGAKPIESLGCGSIYPGSIRSKIFFHFQISFQRWKLFFLENFIGKMKSQFL